MFNASAEIAPVRAGSPAPFSGILIDPETALNVLEEAKAYDAAYAAMIKQNDMLIELQKQKIALEFERDEARANAGKKDMAMMIILAIAAGLVTTGK